MHFRINFLEFFSKDIVFPTKVADFQDHGRQHHQNHQRQ